MAAVLSVRDLRVDFKIADGVVNAVRGVSFEASRGETLAIVGESGSGKSQVMMAVMGLIASNGAASGEVLYQGEDILGRQAALRRIRGAKMTMIFQEPMTSLDPLYKIGRQMALPLMRHQKLSRAAAKERALELLKLVKIPNPALRLDSYPHELSGGQRQRVMIAMAIANEPDLLIADEPTTALDVTVQAQILDLMKELQQRLGMAVIFISHDLNVVRRIADRVLVMHEGRIVEQGPVNDIFNYPRDEYTRRLIAAEPGGSKAAADPQAPVLLKGEAMRVAFKMPRKFLGKRPDDLVAVDNVSVTLKRGETLGIVGESGSGKSTLGRALLKLVPGSGAVTFDGRSLDGMTREALKPVRRDLAIVFQDPFGSLSPRLTAGEIISEGLLVHEPE